jgi:hypothetical protein
MRIFILASALLGLSVVPVGSNGSLETKPSLLEVTASDAERQVDAAQERSKRDLAVVHIDVEDVRNADGDIELHLLIRRNPRFSPGPILLIDKRGKTEIPIAKPIVMRPLFSMEVVLTHPSKEPIEVSSDALILPSDFFDPGSYSVRKRVRIGAVPAGYSVEISIPDLGAVRRHAMARIDV